MRNRGSERFKGCPGSHSQARAAPVPRPSPRPYNFPPRARTSLPALFRTSCSWNHTECSLFGSGSPEFPATPCKGAMDTSVQTDLLWGPEKGDYSVQDCARLCVRPQGKTLLPAPKIKACAAFRTLMQPPGRVPEPPHFLPSVPRTGLTRHHSASVAHQPCPLPFIFPKTQENK